MPVTTLAAAISTTNATTATVRDVVDFPTTGTFDVIIDSERLTIGAGAGTVSWSSITRGAGGTTAATHADGAAVYLVQEAYATAEDLDLRMPESTAVSAGLIADALSAASAHIDARCGRDFYRHPRVSGTEVRYFDGSGTDTLWITERIVSITTLQVASGTNGTYETLAATDYFLEPANLGPGDSYSAIVLADNPLGSVAYTSFPIGKRTVKVTGVFGWSTVPEIIRTGTLALARLMVGTTLTASGSSMGGAEYGPVPVPSLLPLDTYRAIEWGKARVIG